MLDFGWKLPVQQIIISELVWCGNRVLQGDRQQERALPSGSAANFDPSTNLNFLSDNLVENEAD